MSLFSLLSSLALFLETSLPDVLSGFSVNCMDEALRVGAAPW